MNRVLRWSMVACVAAAGAAGCGDPNPPAKAPDQPIMMPPPGGPKSLAPSTPAAKSAPEKP